MEEFENKVDEIKKQKNEIKLSQEFKDNLKVIMDKEYYKSDIDSKITLINEDNDETSKNTKFNAFFPKKIAAIFACIIIVSTCTLAGDWENFFAKLFYNMDSKMSLAIEDEYIKNIDMDYVENNGIKIKVEYLLFDKQSIYIAFNVKAEEDIDEIFLNDIVIKNEGNNIIFDSQNNFSNIVFKSENKKIHGNNIIVLNKFEKNNEEYKDLSKINLEISSIEIMKQNENILLEGNWNLCIDEVIKPTFHNIENIDGYFLDSQKIVNKYDIKIIDTYLKVDLEMNGDILKDYELNKNNIYLEDINNNKYYVSDNFMVNNNKLSFSINLPKNINLDKSKLKIKYFINQEESIILYLQKQG